MTFSACLPGMGEERSVIGKRRPSHCLHISVSVSISAFLPFRACCQFAVLHSPDGSSAALSSLGLEALFENKGCVSAPFSIPTPTPSCPVLSA